MAASSNVGDDEYLHRKTEIAKKYDTSKGPYKRIKILTQQLVESPEKSDSEWGKKHKSYANSFLSFLLHVTRIRVDEVFPSHSYPSTHQHRRW